LQGRISAGIQVLEGSLEGLQTLDHDFLEDSGGIYGSFFDPSWKQLKCIKIVYEYAGNASERE